VRVPLANDQPFFFQPIDDTGQVAHRDHHLFADLAERQLAGVADGGQDVKLRRREVKPLQIVLEFFVGDKIETQKPDPEARGVTRKKRSLVRQHGKKFSRDGDKKQPDFSWSRSVNSPIHKGGLVMAGQYRIKSQEI
jgi:hypothetical protein